MDKTQVISDTVNFVKSTLKDAEGGHDWFHIQRVWNTAKLLAKSEKTDIFVVELGALLHDIADSKFHNGDESIGPKLARTFLESKQVSEAIIEHIEQIIIHISYKSSLSSDSQNADSQVFTSPEFAVIQDADRLDAIGAIGIARCFNYGGFKNRVLYDPDILPHIHQSKEAYKHSNAPTINHFYEKLLLLKNKMNTDSGKRIAEERHAFMEQFLNQFYKEWNGEK